MLNQIKLILQSCQIPLLKPISQNPILYFLINCKDNGTAHPEGCEALQFITEIFYHSLTDLLRYYPQSLLKEYFLFKINCLLKINKN